MYVPAHFVETRPEELARIIREHPLGVLVTHDAEGLDANHLPFEFDPGAGTHGMLTAHVARANPVWQRCALGSPVLVVFRGAEGYVSPNWYPSKHEAHRQVPTWNYEVVHAHGLLTVRDDERFANYAQRTQHIDHAVAGIQHRIGKVGDGQGDGGKDQMLGNIAVIRPAGALGRRIRTAGRQQLQLKGKNVQQ